MSPVVPPAQIPQASMEAVPLATPAQSKLIGVPTHRHPAVQASFSVAGFASLQEDPRMLVPFTTPEQSVQEAFVTRPVVPPEQVPQASTLAVPLTTPAQSVQEAFAMSPVVPPEHIPQASMDAVPFAFPAQSNPMSVPAH